MTLVSQGSILLPSDPDHIMEAQDRQQQLPASSQSAAAASAAVAVVASAAAEQSAGRGQRPESSAAAVADTPCADVMTDLLLPRSLLVSLPVGGVASPVSDAMASIAAASATGSAIEEVSVSAADVPSGARRDWQKPEVDIDRLSLRSLHGHSQKAAAAALSTAGFSASNVSAPGHSPLLLPRLGNRAAAAEAAGDFATAGLSFVGHEPLDVVHQRDCGGKLASGSVGLAGPGCCLLAATPSFDHAASKALLECAKVSYQPLPAANGWPLEAAAAAAAAAATGAGNGVLTLPRVADGLSSDEEGSGGESNDYEGAIVFQGASKQRSGDGCLPAECDSGADDEDAACFFAAHERHMHAKSANERQAVRLIIDDIRRALSKAPTDSLSLGTSSRSPPSQPGSEDAVADVWVIRDSYSEKLRRQDELRRARIETERRYEEEFRRKQAEEVYYLEHEDSKLMTHQQQQQQQHGNTGDQQVDGAAPHTVRSAKPTGDGGVVPQSEATAEGSAEYSEHDRDIAGNWFVKKGKYRPVVASDSDSDGREDISSSATSAIAASSVFLHRQAAGVQRVCHAARLADYRGRTSSRCGDEEPRSAVAAEPTRTQAARYPSNADVGRESSAAASAAATSGSGGGSRGGRSKLMQEHRMSQQLEGRSVRSPQAAVHGQSCSGSSGASDGSGCGDDDCNDADDADDDQDGGGGGSEHREQQQRRLQRQHRSTASADRRGHGADYDTDDETDRLVQNEYRSADGGSVHIPEREAEDVRQLAKRNKAKEVAVYDPDDPTVLIEGILFRASYLGSTQLVSEVQPSKAMRMMQAQEAVGRIKAPEGESQPSTEVDLFVSTEKVMVLNTNLKEIIMDHSLRSISYIADIENVLVVMAKRSVVASPGDDTSRSKKQQKLICHVFDTEEAQLIAKSIGQAFQVAYMEFLKANGIDDPGLLKETTYEDILNQQEIAHDELDMFTRRDMQKEVAISKARGEALGIVVVESGWGSMLPTVVLANMSALGPATRSGQLNIGDQIMAVNGVSLVGLPLSTCQDHIKGVKSQTVVKLTVVSRPPVVDVLIKRPDVKYQLGFSVQNGVICSLLRGGIAERGGIRVGHRIIEINGQSVVATSHEKIVYMLSTLIGEIRMKTMPMSIFRLLTGQELPHYI